MFKNQNVNRTERDDVPARQQSRIDDENFSKDSDMRWKTDE